MDYQAAWDLQEALLLEAVTQKRAVATAKEELLLGAVTQQRAVAAAQEAEKLRRESVIGMGLAGSENIRGIDVTNISNVGHDAMENNGGATIITQKKMDSPGNDFAKKSDEIERAGSAIDAISGNTGANEINIALPKHHLLLCEHPLVYTLGKSGHESNLLISDEQLAEGHIQYVKTNRGGDITFHGPGQLVAYPILDLEQFFTDIGKYLRFLEEVIIRTLSDYGIKGDRSPGETGVWLDVGLPTARKICAMGVRCSRWVTMHGLALNVNTDMRYFGNIIPCGIVDKAVTSVAQELGREVPMGEVEEKMVRYFGEVFGAEMVME